MLYAADPELRGRMDQVVAASDGIGRTEAVDWPSCWRLAPAAGCLVAAIPDPRRDPVVGRLPAFQAEFPALPLVVAVRMSPAFLRRFASVRVHTFVDLTEWTDQLPTAVRRALRQSPARRLAESMWASDDVPVPVRQAFETALSADRPYRRVDPWAAAVGLSASGLRYHWRTTSRRLGWDLRPKEVLSWILLARALMLKPGITWEAVARRLGVHPTTLRRTARRLTGSTLSDLETEGPGSVLKRLAEELDVSISSADDIA